ncbi:hypothetical protein [Paludisphaera mucosa]|uniref:Uncharacterized protein n=1 Tax=Paludisphaera mucosa TaxID=3030827 RepID=A0ABT6F592_9BACT|nr:hypothetical protein [Paludisphaera mucosa]MDG3002584.1 hypothetical protein [Paludisphaera mucosa]
MLKIKDIGLIDLDEIASQGFLPPADQRSPVLCRVQTHRNGGVFWAYCESDDALKIFAMCEERGLDFVGVISTRGW